MAYSENVWKLAADNSYFRQVLATSEKTQVVIMSLLPGEDIGEEIHDVDQVLVFISGSGEAVLNDVSSPVGEGSLTQVPAGTKHNFKNTGATPMKLVTVYAPPEHKDGTIHKTKAEAMADENDHT